MTVYKRRWPQLTRRCAYHVRGRGSMRRNSNAECGQRGATYDTCDVPSFCGVTLNLTYRKRLIPRSKSIMSDKVDRGVSRGRKPLRHERVPNFKTRDVFNQYQRLDDHLFPPHTLLCISRPYRLGHCTPGDWPGTAPAAWRTLSRTDDNVAQMDLVHRAHHFLFEEHLQTFQC